jgi:hypothetical protein
MQDAFTIDATAAKIPYLKFLSIREGEGYTFPHIECAPDKFDSEYTQYMMTLFEKNVTGDTSEISPFTPEHVVIHDKTAIVLFPFEQMAKNEMFRDDAILSLSDSTPALNMKWAIVDEIVFERNIAGVPFDPKVTALFVEHDALWNIEYDEVYIDFPFSVYPVGEVDGKLANVSSEVRKTDMYAQHEDYGDRYCFSYQKIGEAKNPIRYAVYTYNTKYLVDVVCQSGGNPTDKKNMDTDSDESGVDTPVPSADKEQPAELKESSVNTETQETPESNVNTESPETPESNVNTETQETPESNVNTESPETPESSVNTETPESSVNTETQETPESPETPKSSVVENATLDSPEIQDPHPDEKTEHQEVPFVVPTSDSNDSAMADSERENSMLSTPTIYFFETIDEQTVSLWGFTNPELFVKL